MIEIFDSICFLLAKAEQKHYQYLKVLLNKENLAINPGQMLILTALYRQDGISLTELSKKTYMDNSTLNGLLDRLESLEMVSRVAVPEDRREYTIYLSQKAYTLQERLQTACAEVSSTMLDGCSIKEIAIFRKVLLNIFEKL